MQVFFALLLRGLPASVLCSCPGRETAAEPDVADSRSTSTPRRVVVGGDAVSFGGSLSRALSGEPARLVELSATLT